jgi:hypothetical protein
MDGITMNAMASTGFTTRLILQPGERAGSHPRLLRQHADVPTGGVRINIVPREGGNTLNGTFFSSIATHGMQAGNLTDDLRRQGLRTPDAVRKLWDMNPGFGGPIRQNKVWFYVSALYSGSQLDVADMFFNKNANNPNAWTFEPDLNRPRSRTPLLRRRRTRDVAGEPAKQARTSRCRPGRDARCVGVVSATLRPGRHSRAVPDSTPAGARLDVTGDQSTAARGRRGESLRPQRPHRRARFGPAMITVNEQSSGLPCYRAADNFRKWTEPRDPSPVRRVVRHGRARVQGRLHT